MVLRGQGDGPVRICEPCKKLEDAARFELRCGHRSKTPKVSSKMGVLTHGVDTLLRAVVNDDAGIESSAHGASDILQEKHLAGKMEECQDEPYATPEALLEQAEELRKQWLSLKREGKNEEALRAFKRRKELERQAEQLKLSLRRSQKKGTSVIATRKEKTVGCDQMRTSHALTDDSKHLDESGDTISPPKTSGAAFRSSISKQSTNDHEDDLLDELREIGWSELDLHNVGQKQIKSKGVESELTELAASIHGKPQKETVSSMEVLAHKRRALALKREGNLAEAKKELKKAKVLEKELEEQALLHTEESDDELSVLIHGLENENTCDTGSRIDIDIFSGLAQFDHEDDHTAEISDSDMNDPEMLVALKSMGWDNEANSMQKRSSRAHEEKHMLSSHGVTDIFDDQNFEDVNGVHVTDEDMNDPFFLSALKVMGFPEEEPSKLVQPVMASLENSDKTSLEDEIRFLKREAVALKRAGKLEDAKEELRQAKLLEKELHLVSEQDIEYHHVLEDAMPSLGETHFMEEGESMDADVDVTNEDMEDPELVKALKALGWEHDVKSGVLLQTNDEGGFDIPKASLKLQHPKSKSELQKELLGIKRAALKLRRDGKVEQAEIELEKESEVERLIKELENAVEVPKQGSRVDLHGKGEEWLSTQGDKASISYKVDATSVDVEETVNLETAGPTLGSGINDLTYFKVSNPDSLPLKKVGLGSPSSPDTSVKTETEAIALWDPSQQLEMSSSSVEALHHEILGCKTKALALKRDGRLEDAKERLREAKALEKQLAKVQAQVEVHTEERKPDEKASILMNRRGGHHDALADLPVAPRVTHAATKDRLKLQQSSLAHKRRALALRREGKTEEAEAEFELAKSLERERDELGGGNQGVSALGSYPKDADVEDLLDPQLFAALREIGLKDMDVLLQAPKVEHENAAAVQSKPTKNLNQERKKLEEKIKAEKTRAVQLKRAGKQSEALDALRAAKRLEKQLQSM